MSILTVPVLTVRQPWAFLIMAGHKDVENRTWRTAHRGRIAIHAARNVDLSGYEMAERLGLEVPDDLPVGMVLGTVRLRFVVDDSESPWATPGCWHWCLESPRAVRPFPARGQMGLWKIGEQSLASLKIHGTDILKTG